MRLPHTSVPLLLAAAALVALLSPATALAEPAAFEWVRVGLNEDSGSAVVVVAGQLPASAALPAKVSLPVPQGSTVFWVGESLGGDPAADPQSQYTTRTAGGMLVVDFTLTKGRVAQVEAAVPGSLVVEGDTRTLRLDWKAVGPAGRAEAGIVVPPGARVATSTPGFQPQTLSDGGTVFVDDATDVEAGHSFSGLVEYSGGSAAPASGTATGKSSSDSLGLLLAAGVFVVIALVFVAMRRRHGAAEEGRPGEEGREEGPKDQQDDERADSRPLDDGDGLAAVPAVRPRFDRRLVILVLPALVLGGLVFAVQNGPGVTTQSQDSVSRTVGSAEAKATFETPVALDGELVHGSTHVFDALAALPGLSTATVKAPGVLVLTYDPGLVTEEDIRSSLAAAGLTR